jgi:methyltransferase
MIAYAIIALVAAQRVAELWYAQRNTRRLLVQGGVEIGRNHYPLFVLLHTAWLLAIIFALHPNEPLHWAPLLGYILCECLRAWTMLSLGPYWTTRIITLPDAPLVRRGPYRFLRHPNYVVVTCEIALLPLVFAEVWIAAVFSLLNAALLVWRIRVENQALAPRREVNWTLQ